MELKQKFRNGLKALREGAVSVVRRHPVELVLLLALTVTMLEEPTARNSKRLPVNAKAEVR